MFILILCAPRSSSPRSINHAIRNNLSRNVIVETSRSIESIPEYPPNTDNKNSFSCPHLTIFPHYRNQKNFPRAGPYRPSLHPNRKLFNRTMARRHRFFLRVVARPLHSGIRSTAMRSKIFRVQAPERQ
jgi:hypothetical protein